MYEVKIYNDSQETLIHSSNPDKEAPHILSLPFKESLSKPEQLSFTISQNNPGYDLITGIKTKVKVFDIRDSSVVFSGRVMPIQDGMSSEGSFHKQITCEGALTYLIDSNTRRKTFTNETPHQIIEYLLGRHNATVDTSRKVQVGIIEPVQAITISTNYESTLNAIMSKIRNILGGDIRVQERNGVLYLDYLLSQGKNNGVKIELRRNLKSIIREYDPTDFVNRVIPIGYGEGINQLTIIGVNWGSDCIQDSTSVSQYGVIEDVVVNKDIQNADTLKIYGQTVLNEKKQIKLTYQQTALDLSVLTGYENEKYELGDTIQTVIKALDIDVFSRVIERDRDLILSPWDPTLTLSTRSSSLTDQIVELKQKNLTLENSPQGSTYIDTYGYADNVDVGFPFKLPVWISPDILNVNRVRLHIDGQKYRAYEKSTTGGTSSKTTSDASSKTTTDQSSVDTAYVEIWGDPHSSLAIGPPTQVFPNPESGPFQHSSQGYYWGWDGAQTTYGGAHSFCYPDAQFGYYTVVDLYLMQHNHNFSHNHDISHTHGMSHTHTNSINYGIFEDTYPKDVYVKIDGVTVAGPYGNGTDPFSIDLDLTTHMVDPGKTYNLEIVSTQNGRVNAWVSIQAFIQAK